MIDLAAEFRKAWISIIALATTDLEELVGSANVGEQFGLQKFIRASQFVEMLGRHGYQFPYANNLEERWAGKEAKHAQIDFPLDLAQDWCYLVWAEGTARYKIGHSLGLDKRLRGMQTDCPFKTVLLATFKNGSHTEAWLHKRYQGYRKSGEWFELPPPVVAFLVDCSEHDGKENQAVSLRRNQTEDQG